MKTEYISPLEDAEHNLTLAKIMRNRHGINKWKHRIAELKKKEKTK